jgi:hypothetical protein
MHGAGFAVREARGERSSVRSNFSDGSRAKPETIAALVAERPTLQVAFNGYRSDPVRLLGLREVLAMARALADHLVATADLDDPNEILRVFHAQLRVMKLQIRIVASEQKMTPVTPGELDQFLEAVLSTIKSFVPPDQREAALEFLRMQVVADRAH